MGNGVEGVSLPEQVNESQEHGKMCNLVEDIGIQEDMEGRCSRPCSTVTMNSLTSESVENSPGLVLSNIEGTRMETNGHDVEAGNAFSASENLVTCCTRKHIEINCSKDCKVYESPAANSVSIEENTDISLSNVRDRVRSTYENRLDEELPQLETHSRKIRRICESSAVCLNSNNEETSTLSPVVHDSVRNTSEEHSGEELLYCKRLDSEVQKAGTCTLIQIVEATPPKGDASGVIPKDETGDICKTSYPGEPVEKQSQMIMEEMVLEASSKDEISLANMDFTILSQERPMPINSNQKLLVLDVNGLLADIVFLEGPCSRTPDTIISSKAVFTRPFYKDFLDFCFTHFNVGIWTSRTKRNVEMILDFLLGGESKNKLLFCWDQFHCTDSGFGTVEDRNKPLIVKKLKKLWEKDDPKLPWEKGLFNESNTLLLDDTPHKALCNPPHTAIFPKSFRYTDVNDTSLSPEGELRAYLKGLAEAENVQKYVQENPFGQRPITERNLSWRYYQSVIAACSSSSEATCNRYDWKASSEAAPYNRHASYNRRDNHPSSYSDATPRIYENYNRKPNNSSFGLEATRYRHGSDHYSSSSEASRYRNGSDQWKAKKISFPEAAPYRHGSDYWKANNLSSFSAAAPYRRCHSDSYHRKATHFDPSTEATPDRHRSKSYHRTSPCFSSYPEGIPDRRRSNVWTATQASSYSEAIPDRRGSYH